MSIHDCNMSEIYINARWISQQLIPDNCLPENTTSRLAIIWHFRDYEKGGIQYTLLCIQVDKSHELVLKVFILMIWSLSDGYCNNWLLCINEIYKNVIDKLNSWLTLLGKWNIVFWVAALTVWKQNIVVRVPITFTRTFRCIKCTFHKTIML